MTWVGGFEAELNKLGFITGAEPPPLVTHGEGMPYHERERAAREYLHQKAQEQPTSRILSTLGGAAALGVPMGLFGAGMGAMGGTTPEHSKNEAWEQGAVMGIPGALMGGLAGYAKAEDDRREIEHARQVTSGRMSVPAYMAGRQAKLGSGLIPTEWAAPRDEHPILAQSRKLLHTGVARKAGDAADWIGDRAGPLSALGALGVGAAGHGLPGPEVLPFMMAGGGLASTLPSMIARRLGRFGKTGQ